MPKTQLAILVASQLAFFSTTTHGEKASNKTDQSSILNGSIFSKELMRLFRVLGLRSAYSAPWMHRTSMGKSVKPIRQLSLRR